MNFINLFVSGDYTIAVKDNNLTLRGQESIDYPLDDIGVVMLESLRNNISVYARLCNGVDSAYSHIDRLKYFAPTTGSIRCMLVTEKQYASMRILAGEKKKREKPVEYVQISIL